LVGAAALPGYNSAFTAYLLCAHGAVSGEPDTAQEKSGSGSGLP
jgi:hypothetical protein